ncbi:hypothetical protein H633G_07138 [Metarhizium anisopliae BRIP 53284]|nr:hypothetical protein H633G_07138 [Metarhizium anisopliae BRIP 53284]
MFVINFSLYFLSDLKTGTPEDKGANGTSVGRPDISNELEEREVAITARIRVLEIKESEIRRRERKGLQEERDLKERLQFLTDKVVDLQQKLDKSCWDVTELERGIRDAEDDLFSLDD